MVFTPSYISLNLGLLHPYASCARCPNTNLTSDQPLQWTYALQHCGTLIAEKGGRCNFRGILEVMCQGNANTEHREHQGCVWQRIPSCCGGSQVLNLVVPSTLEPVCGTDLFGGYHGALFTTALLCLACVLLIDIIQQRCVRLGMTSLQQIANNVGVKPTKDSGQQES